MTNAIKRFFTGKIEDSIATTLPAVVTHNTDVKEAIREVLRDELPVVLEMAFSSLKSELESIREESRAIALVVDDVRSQVGELRTVNFAGKTVEVLEEAKERANAVSFKDVRDLINMAARRQPEGYVSIYNKVKARTGFSVYDAGKRAINKADGLDGYTNHNKTYVNTLFLNGYKDDLYVIATDMINA